MRSSRFDAPEDRLDEPVTLTERQLRSLRRRSTAGTIALILAAVSLAVLAWGAKTIGAMRTDQANAQRALRDTLMIRMDAVLAQSNPAQIGRIVKQEAEEALAEIPARVDRLSDHVAATGRAVEADAARVEGVQTKLVQIITAQQSVSRAANENAQRITDSDSTAAKRDRALERRLAILEQRVRSPQSTLPTP
jgi:cell pole-organizing protein PopZ